MAEDSGNIPVQVAPDRIDLLNKIIEAYDNLALVSAVDPAQGRVVVRVTPGTREDTIKVLKHLPFPVEFRDDDEE